MGYATKRQFAICELSFLFRVNYTIKCNTYKKVTVHINLCYNKFTTTKITRRNI